MYATYDPRNLKTPLQRNKFDNLTSLMFTYLNSTNNIFYLISKGSKVMHAFHHDTKTGNLKLLHEYSSKNATQYVNFLPRNCVDVSLKETDRAVRLGKDKLIY